MVLQSVERLSRTTTRNTIHERQISLATQAEQNLENVLIISHISSEEISGPNLSTRHSILAFAANGFITNNLLVIPCTSLCKAYKCVVFRLKNMLVLCIRYITVREITYHINCNYAITITICYSKLIVLHDSHVRHCHTFIGLYKQIILDLLTYPGKWLDLYGRVTASKPIAIVSSTP